MTISPQPVGTWARRGHRPRPDPASERESGVLFALGVPGGTTGGVTPPMAYVGKSEVSREYIFNDILEQPLLDVGLPCSLADGSPVGLPVSGRHADYYVRC